MDHRRLLRSGAMALALCASSALAAPTFTTTSTCYPEAVVGKEYRCNAEGRVQATGQGTILYSLIDGPAGMRVDPLAGTVRWTPTAVATAVGFTLQAKDELGETRQAFQIAVKDVFEPPNTVTASVSSNTALGAAPLAVTFTLTASSSLLDQIDVVWEAGDGSAKERGDGATWTHTYRLPGVYLARATAYDQHGAFAVAEKLIEVKSAAGQLPPRARITANVTSGPEPLSVALACDCVAGSGAISKYLWSLNGHAWSTAQTVTGSLPAGRYQVGLMVVDANGLATRTEVELTATKEGNVPPRCFARAEPSVGIVPAEVVYSVTAEPGTANLKRVEWTLDDWSVVRAFTAARAYDTAGWYVARVEVEDELGFKCQSSATFAGTSASGAMPPALLSGASSAAVCGERYEYQPSILGDGAFTWSLSEHAPAGMSVEASTGKISWMPTPAQRGEYSFALTATGDAGKATEYVWLQVTCPDKLDLEAAGCATGGFELVAGGALLVAWALRRRRR